MSILSRFRRTPREAEAPEPKPVFSQEQMATMVELLAAVGLQDVEDFVYHATHEASYHSYEMEYTERWTGMRFIVVAPARGAAVHVVRHGAPVTAYSDELIEATNRKLVTLFSTGR